MDRLQYAIMGRINERMLSGMGATRGGRGVRVYVGSGGRSKTTEVLDDITIERAFDNRMGLKKLKRDRNQESAHQASGRIRRVFFGTATGDF